MPRRRVAPLERLLKEDSRARVAALVKHLEVKCGHPVRWRDEGAVEPEEDWDSLIFTRSEASRLM